eukprot:gb/GECG01004111.1/.p1 GENE.gb/GECG01004111.1/~~gb/GECG01004111.1/.p1  ORF type:complete len:443 (+),score=58.85 gb/GECG01004111.1/:1-1329(+)
MEFVDSLTNSDFTYPFIFGNGLEKQFSAEPDIDRFECESPMSTLLGGRASPDFGAPELFEWEDISHGFGMGPEGSIIYDDIVSQVHGDVSKDDFQKVRDKLPFDIPEEAKEVPIDDLTLCPVKGFSESTNPSSPRSGMSSRTTTSQRSDPRQDAGGNQNTAQLETEGTVAEAAENNQLFCAVGWQTMDQPEKDVANVTEGNGSFGADALADFSINEDDMEQFDTPSREQPVKRPRADGTYDTGNEAFRVSKKHHKRSHCTVRRKTEDLPAGERKRRAERVKHSEMLSQYAAHNHEQVNGHRIQIFFPNGKRKCGFIACVHCGAAITLVRVTDEHVEEPVEASLKTILHTPSGDSIRASDVIPAYFDSPCNQMCYKNSVNRLEELGTVLSLYTGDRVRDMSHSLSQHVKRNMAREGESYKNRGYSLSALPSPSIPKEIETILD